jgi:hypothetical protein
MGLTDSPLCRKCGVKDETSAVFFVGVKLWLRLGMSIWAPFWSQTILKM